MYLSSFLLFRVDLSHLFTYMGLCRPKRGGFGVDYQSEIDFEMIFQLRGTPSIRFRRITISVV